MKFLLSDEVQVEVYAKALNLTTRTDMVDNKYFQAEPLVQDVAKALAVGRTPYTLTFFEQINSPQGPWLQMLQRAYYTDDNLDTVIADAKKADEGHRRASLARRAGRRHRSGPLDGIPSGSSRPRDPAIGRTDVLRTRHAAGWSGCLPGAGTGVRAGVHGRTRWARWSGCRCTTGR